MLNLEKRNRALFEQMLHDQDLRPKLTLPLIIAFAMAAIIHCSTLIFFAIGIHFFQRAITIGDIRALAYGLFGLISFTLTWGVVPRLATIPDKDILTRQAYPALYSLVDQVAGSLNVPLIHGIVVTPKYNASFQKIGYRQETILSLGIPLWYVLSDQEKIALIAHELSHYANGDFSRGFVVGTACVSLQRWCVQLAPSLFLLPLPWGILLVLRRLLFFESRRAEYLADYLATSISGTEDMIRMLEKLNFSLEFPAFLKRQVETHRTTQVMERFRAYITDLPAERAIKIDEHRREKERLYGLTHPPLAYRIQFIKAQATSSPKVQLSPQDAAKLEKEFATSVLEVQRMLINLQPNALIFQRENWI